MSVEAGLWSCLPASDATARTLFNNNVDALAPSSPLFSFFLPLFLRLPPLRTFLRLHPLPGVIV